MPLRRALLLVNRKSRNGNAELEASLKVLQESAVQVIEAYPETAGEIPDLIALHAREIDQVILGGGDGTMNAAASALIAHDLPFGILPMGTANDLARTLGIPTALRDAAAIIATGASRRIDVACVNDAYFFNVANIGLGVQVKHELTDESKRRWGILSYAKGVLGAYRKNTPFVASITCDGKQVTVPSIQIAIGNGRYYGGGMAVAENAAIDDHLFSLYSLEPVSLWSLFTMMPALRTGQLDAIEPALLMQGKQISIATHKPMPVSMDGEIRTTTPAMFSMLPDALRVFVPDPHRKIKGISDAHQERQTSCA